MIVTEYMTLTELNDFLTLFKQVECLECVEGCLQDNVLYEVFGDHVYGAIAVYEHYRNSCSSDLEVRYAITGTDDMHDLVDQFYYTFQNELEEE